LRLLAELKRRNVIRMAGLYLVGAWLLIQIAETLLPIFHTPDWVLQALVVLLALGFLPAMVFSWVFELTPDGLKRETEIDRTQSIANHTARKLDIAVIVLLLAVAALVLSRPNPPPESTAAQSAVPPATPSPPDPAPADQPDQASIAVLPFADLSQAGDQAYFSDGIAEEILNVLARTQGLQVASRTSSFGFKGQESLGIPAIAEKLFVRHVLEGSVRRSGDTIRITAQLIDARKDRHLWSQTFDRPLTAENLFAIQDEIANAIVAALVQSLQIDGVGDVADTQPTADLTAYDLYLRARALVQARRSLDQADRLLGQALDLDPQFAQAWELRAAVVSLTAEYLDTDVSPDELDQRGIEYAQRALALKPASALAMAVRANIRLDAATGLRGKQDFAAIIAELEQSLAIDPNSANALNWLTLAWAAVGRLDQALASVRRCRVVDPRFAPCAQNEYMTLYAIGEVEQARAHLYATMRSGVVTSQFVFLPLLAHVGDEAAFLFAINQSLWLPGWQRQGDVYQALRNPDADHSALVRELRVFLATHEEVSGPYLGGLLVPLGIFDVATPTGTMLWGPDFRTYRQSQNFKSMIRDSGVHAYWQTQGFPPNCKPLAADDFECD
jgi:TolB-like protein/Tfp pilus assembly protein PilF